MAYWFNSCRVDKELGLITMLPAWHMLWFICYGRWLCLELESKNISNLISRLWTRYFLWPILCRKLGFWSCTKLSLCWLGWCLGFLYSKKIQSLAFSNFLELFFIHALCSGKILRWFWGVEGTAIRFISMMFFHRVMWDLVDAFQPMKKINPSQV